MTELETYKLVLPILQKTYGDGPMVPALAKDLAETIVEFPYRTQYRSREDVIMLKCWDWFSGGDTAASVAANIEDALLAAVITG